MIDRDAINFAWLTRLRWGAIAGQVVTVLAVWRLLGVELPLGPLFAVIFVEAAVNTGCALLSSGGRQVREQWLLASMIFDTLVLTALLALTGGSFNPFNFLYLVHIALGAVVLRERWTWVLAGLSLAAAATLFAVHRELPLPGGSHADHMSLHLYGMLVAQGVAAVFIVYFLLRITRALAAREASLRAAHAIAEKQEKLLALATLAAGAAHELATPLSTIALVAKELVRQLDPGETRGSPAAPARAVEDARLIRAQVERCREILDRMGTSAGRSNGEGIVEAPLSEVIARALDGLDTSRAVAVEHAPGLAQRTVRLPPRAFAQALRALVQNAQDASPADAVVKIRTAADDGVLRVEVVDEGRGMDADVLAHAGEPFFTTKPPGRGTGLGLFLARMLMEQLGGSLDIESTEGRGTRIELRLPEDVGPALVRPS